MFTVDGVQWSIPCDISRSMRIQDSDISGQLLNGQYFHDVGADLCAVRIIECNAYSADSHVPRCRITDIEGVFDSVRGSSVLTDSIGSRFGFRCFFGITVKAFLLRCRS